MVERGEEQGAGTSAEIEDRRRPRLAEMRQRRLDERLAVRPGNEHPRPHLQLDRPEVAAAEDIGHRLARLTPRDKRLERSGRFVVEVRQKQLLARNAKRMRHQQLRIEARACRR